MAHPAPDPSLAAVEHSMVQTNGVCLHVASAGDVAAPPVILLHGFPEFWYGWRHQIPALAEAGYRVLAPDQRGYNLSDKPKGLAAYTLDTLAADVIGLIEAAGREQVIVIGHDWGAAVAWWTALKYPRRVEKLVILNVPHPAVMLDMLSESRRQRLKSWYIAYFQIPRLPEWLLGLGGGYGLATMMFAASGPNALNDADIARYQAAWAQPGALTAMLNWYRALVQRRPAMPANLRIRVPTRILWGEKDIALVPELADASAALCDDARIVRFPNASHFVQHDEPAAVNAAILEFIGRA